MLSGRKKHGPIHFILEDTVITSKKAIKYLGVMMNKNLSIGAHIQYAVDKAERTLKAISKIMPRVNGPTSCKQKILSLCTVLKFGQTA